MFLSTISVLLPVLLLSFTPSNAQTRQAVGTDGYHWVDTWTTMPQLTEFANLPPAPFNETNLVFNNSTIRQTLHMTLGADQIRVRFTNAFGLNDLPITAVTIAMAYNNTAGSSQIVSSTLQHLTFSGSKSISIPDGGLAVSDAIDFHIVPESIITISMYLANGQASNFITSHPGSRTITWFTFGNQITAKTIDQPGTASVAHWFFLDAIEAWAPSSSSAFAIVGDSITDGRGSDTNQNDRWPDDLFRVMQNNTATANIAVVNQAAGGNRVLYDGLGPNALSRIDRDVLAQSGVRYAMIFEGVNDLGTADSTVANLSITYQRLTQAYQQIVQRVHTFGIPMFGATITPFCAPNSTIQPYSSALRERYRLKVNDFIRNSGTFDAVVDFDKLLRDPKNHTQLNPIYNSGDYLHPNEAGYKYIAANFPLNIFTQFAGGVNPFD